MTNCVSETVELARKGRSKGFFRIWPFSQLVPNMQFLSFAVLIKNQLDFIPISELDTQSPYIKSYTSR